MSYLGLLCFYLGIEVHQDHSGIYLCQTAYAKRIIELGGPSAACATSSTLGYVNRFMLQSMTEHLQAVKRILCYVAGTSDYCLHYPRCLGTAHFIGYSYSDHAGDIDMSKSTSGIVVPQQVLDQLAIGQAAGGGTLQPQSRVHLRHLHRHSSSLAGSTTGRSAKQRR